MLICPETNKTRIAFICMNKKFHVGHQHYKNDWKFSGELKIYIFERVIFFSDSCHSKWNYCAFCIQVESILCLQSAQIDDPFKLVSSCLFLVFFSFLLMFFKMNSLKSVHNKFIVIKQNSRKKCSWKRIISERNVVIWT